MWVIIVLTAITAGLVHWILTSPYGYWKKRGVPNPKPTIVFGNLGPSVTLKKNLGQVYKEIYDKYQDCAYVGYYKFRKPGIILRDMDLIKDILAKEFSSFHDNDIHVDAKVDPFFSKNPFCLIGDEWKAVRALITPSITHSKIRNMFSFINTVGDNMIKYLHSSSEATGQDGIEAKELAAKFTTDAVATYAFGIDGRSFEDPNAEFREMGRKFLNTSFWKGIQHMVLLVLPDLARWFKVKLIPSEVEKWFSEILLEAIKYREKHGIVRNDYLDLLISLKTKPFKYGFNDIDVLAQAMTFYGDGFETSSITLSFTLYEIARHPDVQKRLQQEVDEVLKKHNDEVTYEAIQEMEYLDRVLAENLRINSPALFIVRLCTKQYVLPPPRGEGTGPSVTLQPGTPVVIPVLAIHADPNIYPDPTKFDPERFTEENKNNRPKYSFLAFGEGPRICFGMRFALAQTKAALVRIMSEFNITVNQRTLEPLQLDPKYFMAAAVGGLWLNFHKRTK